MTERLYYTDATCREFDATVVAVDGAGPMRRVCLDRTAFYPTSGGQPFDTGSLAAGRIVDVSDEGDRIWHVVDGVPASIGVGDRVRGVIDWPRRFDHMQQHTGQHILSAAFDRLHGARTIAFHLGTDTATIDLAANLTPAQIASAEQAANDVVWDDRPIHVRFVTEDEARALPLRKESERAGLIRLVEVDAFDLSACGGTHVSRSGSVGLVAVTRVERVTGGLRVEFVCGGRALASHRAMRDVVTGVAKQLSAGPADFAGAISRLQDEVKIGKRAAVARDRELASYRAAALAASAESVPCGWLVAAVVDADTSGVKALASALGTREHTVAVIASKGQPVVVAVACSPDSGTAATDVLSVLTDVFGGKGGGRADFAQAGGLSGSPDAALEKARLFLRSR